MKVFVKWNEHDRLYSVGIQRFLKSLDINVDDAQIISAIKNLLEQEEMQGEHSEHQ